MSSLFATQFFCFQDPISKPTILGSKTCMLGLGKGRISKKSFSVDGLQLTKLPSG